MKTTLLAAALAAATLAACGGEPADVSGSYTIALTNRENGCENPNWTEGNSLTGVGIVINQNGESINIDVQHVGARAALDFVLGSHLFTGSVDGDEIDAVIVGTPSFSRDTCDYTVDAQIHGGLDGDVLTGNIYYRAQTDGSVDCGTLTGCSSRQEFNGTRPPS